MATVKARIVANPNVRAKQVSIGAASVNLATKSIQELSDVEATETNKGLLQYDQASDMWSFGCILYELL